MLANNKGLPVINSSPSSIVFNPPPLKPSELFFSMFPAFLLRLYEPLDNSSPSQHNNNHRQLLISAEAVTQQGGLPSPRFRNIPHRGGRGEGKVCGLSESSCHQKAAAANSLVRVALRNFISAATA